MWNEITVGTGHKKRENYFCLKEQFSLKANLGEGCFLEKRNPEYFSKAEEAEIKLPICIGSSKREFQKNIYFCFVDYAKALDYVDHNKLWKILQEMGLLIWTGGSTPLLCLEGVPDLPVAPQDEAGLTKTFQTWPRGWFHIP